MTEPYSIRGIAYPLEIDPTTGGLKVATDAELIGGHIRSVLETEPGENPMRPEYGTPGAIFSSFPDFSVYGAEVQRRLSREIPQADFAVTAELGDDGQGLLIVVWSVAGVPGDPLSIVIE